jgi:hypothetical protein
MPTSIDDLLRNSSCRDLEGPVPWENVKSDIAGRKGGIYIVSLSDEPRLTRGIPWSRGLIDESTVTVWLGMCPNFEIDNHLATTGGLVKRLSEFWLPDESILYIGETGDVIRDRINAYIRTPPYKRSPHAGGRWINTLSIKDQLNIFWTTTPDDTKTIEGKLISKFAKNVSDRSKANLRDNERCYPFANVKGPYGNKNHGMNRFTIGRNPGTRWING